MAVLKRDGKNLGNFENWDRLDVEDLLGVQCVILKELTDLQNSKIEMPISIWEGMQWRLNRFKEKEINLNELEVRTLLIAPFLDTIDFHGKGYSNFQGKLIQYNTPAITVKGYADWMCASGRYLPKTPYFFIHEYKKSRGTVNDELGQLLIEMYTADRLNDKKRGIVGCTVVGRDWKFVFYKDKKYAVSKEFDMTEQKDFKTIWQTLSATKQLIEKWAAEDYVEIKVID